MKFIIPFLLFIFAQVAMADFSINEVTVDCPKSLSCDQRKLRFEGLVGDYRSLVHLRDTLKVMASDGGYQTFSYVIKEENKKNILTITFKLKPVIEDINIGFVDRNIDYDPSQLLTIREGEFFETQKLKANMEAMQKRLEAMGFPHNTHTFEVMEKNEKVKIFIAITLGKPRIFKGIKSNASSSYVRDYLVRKFYNLYNKPFELTKFKMYLDDAQKELFNYGYFLVGLDFIPIYKEDRVTLDIKVTDDRLFAIDFQNLQRESRDVLHNLVLDLLRKYKRPLSEQTLKQALQEHYKTRALLNASFKIETSEYKNSSNEVVYLYRIILDEKYKTRLINVSFAGNNFFKTEKLKRMFDKEAFELASIHYYDDEYFKFFLDYLKTEYISKGFVQVKIQGPISTFDSEKKTSNVEYVIHEGTRAFVRSIDFQGMPLEFEDKILGVLSNKVGNAFNPISMVEDIKKVASILQENGYYYAEVTNANDNGLVAYSKSGADVDIHFKVNAGSVVRLNRILFLGNDKTKKKVLWKKIPLEKGDIITPNRARDIEAAMSATGLFNSVSVSPVKHSSSSESTDLLVKVTEREYGLVQVAPGFRTDLGMKLTGTASYTNLEGMNRALTLQSQLNQRVNYQTLDPERRKNAKPLLEHNTSLTYTQGDIFDTQIDLSATGGYQFKRFYSFDAEIARGNVVLTRDLSKRISSSVRYQLEDITQKNATNEQDNGNFRIGAITPSFTFDFRNSQVNPVKGAFFNLSCEFANPFFLSQKEPDLTINYYKLISRNRFYIPFKNGTLALSFVGGMQENLENKILRNPDGSPQVVNGVTRTQGYIPNIKVFRLTGVDIVRGFNDEEINRLPDGSDIADARVQGKAYLVNLKVEPRYFINDSLMAGVFYDAGRVFLDSVDLGKLRDSVGITFKILTPVGTLDFDYGIKLLREKDRDGKLESPGRFHVSIGFF